MPSLIRQRLQRNRFKSKLRVNMFSRLRTRTLYQAFLQSSLWQAIRERKLRQSPTCEFITGGEPCGSRYDLQCHHVRYPVRWEQTQMHHLQTLCRPHHAAIHGKAI